MLSRVMYEQQLLEEIKGLSAHEMERLLKLVHLVREEFMKPKATVEAASIMSFAGCLSDLKAEDEAVFDQASARRSMFAERGQML
ncbi:MAG: hypothetical protein HYV06_10140 [Deltaproteobacteria bacterium]|nr:hypothetical protein [Deltaproteobacteria bacterium]